jgi:hypothetical protein
MATKIESGTNNVIVSINGTMQKDIYNMIRRANINPGSQININDYVNITGRVVAIPRSVCKRPDYKGFSVADIEVGDMLIFSYLVVGEITEKEGGEYEHKNSVVIRGKEYWLCDIRNAFARIRSGEMTMLNSYIMISPPTPPNRLILPSVDGKVKKWGVTAEVQAVGRESALNIGDTVCLDYNKVQIYELGETKFGIIDAKHIYSKN